MAIFNKDARALDDTRNPTHGGTSSLSIIAAGTSIDGDIETEGVIRVEGRVEGSIHAGRQVLMTPGTGPVLRDTQFSPTHR